MLDIVLNSAIRSMISAVFSFGKSLASLESTLERIRFSSFLLLVFRIDPSALHRLKGTSPIGYFNAFSKSTVLTCFTDTDRSFPNMSRLTSTLCLLLVTVFFTAELKFKILSLLIRHEKQHHPFLTCFPKNLGAFVCLHR